MEGAKIGFMQGFGARGGRWILERSGDRAGIGFWKVGCGFVAYSVLIPLQRIAGHENHEDLQLVYPSYDFIGSCCFFLYLFNF